MNKTIRRFLLFFSYTTFVVVAPLIILYAIGYRPQISSPIPRPVGVILADAFPKKANIAVNEVSYGTLPRSVSNVEPGMAKVQITKEGYSPWEKLLEVKPTQATDIRSIRLLPVSFEKVTIAQNIKLFAPSPNNLLLAGVTSKNTLTILDDTGVAILPQEQLTDRPTAITWSPDGAHILITLPKNTYQLFAITEKAIDAIATKNLTGITNILWSPLSENTLYGLDKNKTLISYSISTGIQETVIKNVNTYEIANRTIYYQTFQNQLMAQNIRSTDSRIISANTEKTLKKISVNSNGTLALLFGDGELKIQKQNGDTTDVSPVSENMWWSPDSQLLLVQTSPTELSIYNVENERLFALPQGELHLLTRLSQPITHPQWFSDSLHIFYQTNNSLFFSEIDTRDHAIAFPIDAKKISGAVSIGDQAKSIWNLEQAGTDTRLVQTWLVTKEDR